MRTVHTNRGREDMATAEMGWCEWSVVEVQQLHANHRNRFQNEDCRGEQEADENPSGEFDVIELVIIA